MKSVAITLYQSQQIVLEGLSSLTGLPEFFIDSESNAFVITDFIKFRLRKEF